MQNLETLTLTTDDMMRICKLSRVTIYRRNQQEARERRGKWPLPIPSEPKQALRWNAAVVLNFLQSASTSQTSSTPLIESAKSIQKRHADAMKELEKLGIKVTFTQKVGENDH